MPVQPEDLTAKARIRRAALELFARQGYSATSMRSIAARAHVSPSLVVHHFRTKSQLRKAVDDAVVAAFAEVLANVDLTGSPQDVSAQLETALSGLIGGTPAVRDHLARSLLEGEPAGQRLFDELMDLVEHGISVLEANGHVQHGTDRTWRSYTTAFIILGPMLLGRQIEVRLGDDAFAPEAVSARSASTMHVLRHGLFRTHRTPRA